MKYHDSLHFSNCNFDLDKNACRANRTELLKQYLALSLLKRTYFDAYTTIYAIFFINNWIIKSFFIFDHYNSILPTNRLTCRTPTTLVPILI